MKKTKKQMNKPVVNIETKKETTEVFAPKVFTPKIQEGQSFVNLNKNVDLHGKPLSESDNRKRLSQKLQHEQDLEQKIESIVPTNTPGNGVYDFGKAMNDRMAKQYVKNYDYATDIIKHFDNNNKNNGGLEMRKAYTGNTNGNTNNTNGAPWAVGAQDNAQQGWSGNNTNTNTNPWGGAPASNGANTWTPSNNQSTNTWGNTNNSNAQGGWDNNQQSNPVNTWGTPNAGANPTNTWGQQASAQQVGISDLDRYFQSLEAKIQNNENTIRELNFIVSKLTSTIESLCNMVGSMTAGMVSNNQPTNTWNNNNSNAQGGWNNNQSANQNTWGNDNSAQNAWGNQQVNNNSWNNNQPQNNWNSNAQPQNSWNANSQPQNSWNNQQSQNNQTAWVNTNSQPTNTWGTVVTNNASGNWNTQTSSNLSGDARMQHLQAMANKLRAQYSAARETVVSSPSRPSLQPTTLVWFNDDTQLRTFVNGLSTLNPAMKNELMIDCNEGRYIDVFKKVSAVDPNAANIMKPKYDEAAIYLVPSKEPGLYVDPNGNVRTKHGRPLNYKENQGIVSPGRPNFIK